MEPIELLIYTLIVTAFMPFVAKAPLAFAMYKFGIKDKPGYDNRHPREQQKQLSGFGARCLAAHENSFEALIIHATAILLVIATNNVTEKLALYSCAFVFFRGAYLVFYWINLDKLRSTVWFFAIASSFAMMIGCLPA